MSKITKSAEREDCQVRIIGVCNFEPATTVFAHLNGGGGAMKHLDIHGAYCCSDCHSWLDGLYVKTATRAERDLLHFEGMLRTQIILFEKGLISIK